MIILYQILHIRLKIEHLLLKAVQTVLSTFARGVSPILCLVT